MTLSGSLRRLLLLGFVLAGTGCGSRPASGPLPFAWPPQPGEPFPDLQLSDFRGEPVRLSDYRGKVLLVEPIGMTCAACNAFAGGNRPGVGPFDGSPVQAGLPSNDEAARTYGAVSLDDPRIVFVDLILYGPGDGAPSVAEVRAWAEHYGLDRKPNHVVLVGDERMLGPATYALIPGLWLVDRDFVLRRDAAGGRAPDDLWTDLWPAVAELL